jgi:hypothetical protein
VLAVAALWRFSWTNLVVAFVLYWLAGGLGICLGYHRLLTHRGFRTSKVFEYFLAVCGTLSFERRAENTAHSLQLRARGHSVAGLRPQALLRSRSTPVSTRRLDDSLRRTAIKENEHRNRLEQPKTIV